MEIENNMKNSSDNNNRNNEIKKKTTIPNINPDKQELISNQNSPHKYIIDNLEKWEDIPQLSVITGKNGVGKSLLLKYVEHTADEKNIKNMYISSYDFHSDQGIDKGNINTSNTKIPFDSDKFYKDPTRTLTSMINMLKTNINSFGTSNIKGSLYKLFEISGLDPKEFIKIADDNEFRNRIISEYYSKIISNFIDKINMCIRILR